MSRIYDNWERLVGATLDREELRELARAPILSSISSDFSSRFSSSVHDRIPVNLKICTHIGYLYPSPSIIGWQGYTEWLVNYLRRFHHPNVIKLIAYCTDGDNLLLVYEFMPKGSLDNHLFRSRLHQNNFLYDCLSWSTRIKVAVDTAGGLSFLHDAKNKVIHRHIKSSNILLDKVCSLDILCCHLTYKCDVYGFGVVLLELLSGCRAIDRSISKNQVLVDWARPYLSKKKVHRVVDSKLKGQYPQEGAVIVSNLALQCTSQNPKSRPLMEEVLAASEPLQGSYENRKFRFF
ncbi:probable serine threonine- kinase PBL3 [Olea europaea subsp. europaea]|uniref:Probable serine threonine- kinase PBL3 n=1 Tax=Olea europaea subsp. europaea TaxID=158383 RepID=A0A8S0QA09_OLEEU|nr:probable serine threonine- kinase PBL3 [Olea europaea subsp. europaea]